MRIEENKCILLVKQAYFLIMSYLLASVIKVFIILPILHSFDELQSINPISAAFKFDSYQFALTLLFFAAANALAISLDNTNQNRKKIKKFLESKRIKKILNKNNKFKKEKYKVKIDPKKIKKEIEFLEKITKKAEKIYKKSKNVKKSKKMFFRKKMIKTITALNKGKLRKADKLMEKILKET